MISVLVKNIEDENILIDGESFTHLRSALRVKLGDSVLTIDGQGKKRLATVLNIGKKSLELSGGDVELTTRLSSIDILLSPPKRDALNDSLRMACELGVRSIFLYSSEYTQNKKLDLERMQKILHSAVVQSNNSFIPSLFIIKSLDEITASYKSVRVFHLTEEPSKGEAVEEDVLLAIGPEGGFSEADIEEFKARFPLLELVTLKTPILRTPTALCAAFSWVLSRI